MSRFQAPLALFTDLMYRAVAHRPAQSPELDRAIHAAALDCLQDAAADRAATMLMRGGRPRVTWTESGSAGAPH